jgi:multiple sugar transport system ATP-binding protein
MNLLEGKVEGGDRPRLALPGGSNVTIGEAARAFVGRDVIFGIRPEHIRLDPIGGLLCAVSLVEPTGSETHVVAHAGETEIIALLRERTDIHEGETVRLSLDASQAHFFETASGGRLSLA